MSNICLKEWRRPRSSSRDLTEFPRSRIGSFWGVVGSSRGPIELLRSLSGFRASPPVFMGGRCDLRFIWSFDVSWLFDVSMITSNLTINFPVDERIADSSSLQEIHKLRSLRTRSKTWDFFRD